jgi:hypothetical protein
MGQNPFWYFQIKYWIETNGTNIIADLAEFRDE